MQVTLVRLQPEVQVRQVVTVQHAAKAIQAIRVEATTVIARVLITLRETTAEATTAQAVRQEAPIRVVTHLVARRAVHQVVRVAIHEAAHLAARAVLVLQAAVLQAVVHQAAEVHQEVEVAANDNPLI